MTDEGPRNYSFSVRPGNVPRSLQDVPLPLEVFGPDDERTWAVVELREGASTTVRVNQPGRHDVRAKLPSGEPVRFVVHVSSEGKPPPVVEVDFGRRVPERDGLLAGRSDTKWTPPRSLFKTVGDRRLLGTAVTPDTEIIVQCKGWQFSQWTTPATKDPTDLGLACAPIANTRMIRLSANIDLGDHPGWVDRRPTLLQIRPQAAETDLDPEVLVVLPPVSKTPSVSFVHDADPHPDHGPHLLASVEGADHAAETLFGYVRAGDFDAARQAQPIVGQELRRLLTGPEPEPVSAAVAAYALYRLGDRGHAFWLKNLADTFRFIPDGAIIWASFMILNNAFDEAWMYFKTALDRGIPMYSEGLTLLSDGLALLQHARDAADVRAYASRAYRLAALANTDSELACLRVSSTLRIDPSASSG